MPPERLERGAGVRQERRRGRTLLQRDGVGERGSPVGLAGLTAQSDREGVRVSPSLRHLALAPPTAPFPQVRTGYEALDDDSAIRP